MQLFLILKITHYVEEYDVNFPAADKLTGVGIGWFISSKNLTLSYGSLTVWWEKSLDDFPLLRKEVNS